MIRYCRKCDTNTLDWEGRLNGMCMDCLADGAGEAFDNAVTYGGLFKDSHNFVGGDAGDYGYREMWSFVGLDGKVYTAPAPTRWVYHGNTLSFPEMLERSEHVAKIRERQKRMHDALAAVWGSGIFDWAVTIGETEYENIIRSEN